MGSGNIGERHAVIRSLSPDIPLLQTQLFDALEPVASLTDRAFLANCLFDLYGHLQDLLHRHDRISMASSIEMRVPFIENGLIDFAAHLPRWLKLRRKTGKWLLRQVAFRHLPASNVRAPKNGFGISPAFSEGSQELLRNGLLRDAMRWSRPAVDGVMCLAGRHEYSRQRLVGMEIFLRLYQAGEPPQAIAERLLACAAS
jgi:asparagine synthase (glutamine-hydrolysing)